MVKCDMNKADRIVKRTKGSQGRSTEVHNYLRNKQKIFLQMKMKEGAHVVEGHQW